MTEHGEIDIIHLDMDAFFASVEVLSEPSLSGRPVVVGGVGVRGVVASASYEARCFGVSSAMAMSEARRRCPDAVFIQGRHSVYSAVSERLFALLRTVTPLVEPIALDEAYMDVSGAHRLLGSSTTIAERLRALVRVELALSCSVGVGRTKLVAKLASEAAKPRVSASGRTEAGRGVVVVEPGDELAFLAGHPVRALPGVGPRTEERLARLGVTTVRDLAALGEGDLIAHFGRTHGEGLFALAHGRDGRAVVADRAARSIGHEQTFSVDDRSRSSLESKLREQAVAVAQACRDAGVAGRTVRVKVRFGDFATITRQHTAPAPIGTAAAIAELAVVLLSGVDVDPGVRLIGLSLAELEPAGLGPARQLELFSSAERDDARQRDLELATDDVRRRFGRGAISSAASWARREDERPGPIIGD